MKPYTQNDSEHVQPFIHYETSGINGGHGMHTFDTSGIPDLGRKVSLEITSYSQLVTIFVDVQKKGGGRFGRDIHLSHTFDFETDDNMTLPLYDDWCLCVTSEDILNDGDIFWVRLQHYDNIPSKNKKWLRHALK